MYTVSIHCVQYIAHHYDYMTLEEIGRLVVNVLGAGWKLIDANKSATMIITLNDQFGGVGFINPKSIIINFPHISKYDATCELRDQLTRFRRLCFMSKL